MEKKLIKAWINPLAFIEVDEPWASRPPSEVTAEIILGYMCPTTSPDVKTLVEKYKEISVEEKRLNVVPAEERILEKLIWPLRHAKAAYMVGNNLGTISLCGIVAEMVTVLYFDISNILIGGDKLDEDKQKLLFGRRFEKLGQERRVKILRSFNIISEEMEDKLNQIRMIRRKYLHLWSQDHERLPKDAIEIFKMAESIVAEIIGQDIEDGYFKLNPAILKYLERKGAYEPED